MFLLTLFYHEKTLFFLCMLPFLTLQLSFFQQDNLNQVALMNYFPLDQMQVLYELEVQARLVPQLQNHI